MKRDIWETKVRSIKLTDNLKDSAQLLSKLHNISSGASLKQIKVFLSDNDHRIFGLYDPFNDWKLLSVITFSLDKLNDINIIQFMISLPKLMKEVKDMESTYSLM